MRSCLTCRRWGISRVVFLCSPSLASGTEKKGKKMKRIINKLLSWRLIVVMLWAACNVGVSSTESFIAGTDYKLWRQVKDSTYHKGLTTYYWYFDKKGKWQVYVKYKNDNKIVKPNLGDVVLIEKWSINNGSVIIGGKSYKIMMLNDTCFSFKDSSKNTTINLQYKNDKLQLR